MQRGPRLIGLGPQLSTCMDVERSTPETKRGLYLPQSPCPVLSPGMCLGQAGSPALFVTFPNSASSHGSLPPAGGSSAWHASPAPGCLHARLFHGPLALPFPLLGMPRRSVFVLLANSSCSFPRSSSHAPPLWSLLWPPQQSRSPHPPSPPGKDSGIAVHFCAGTSEGSACSSHR